MKFRLIAVAFSFAVTAVTSIQAVKAQETRAQNAQRLIAQNEQFKKKAAELHGRAEAGVNAANHLRGDAQQLQIRLKAGTPEYNEAAKQYQGDINQFRSHADAYNAHIADFQKTIGECHANEQQYKANLDQFSLHTQIFHMPNVKPPHICKRLNMSEADSARLANTMRIDQMRLLESEQALNTQENRLKVAEQESLVAANKATNAAVREQREEQLAGEFGKLKEEYDMLKVENEALYGKVVMKPGPTHTGIGSVHGTVTGAGGPRPGP